MVWLARAASSGTTCALKLLRPGFVERPEGQAAFSRLIASVQIHGRLHHPNLVEIHEAVQDPARHLFGIAMGYVEGQTLADIPIPPAVVHGQDLRGLATVLSWFEELGASLAWLHTQRIVHGNLKPTNVMLSEQQGRSVVKVLDLCWAAIGIAAPPAHAPWSVSPEQLRGQPPTKDSDQWALASMLTRMLNGGHAQPRLGVLPQVLVMALTRALDERPTNRFPHMADLVSAIRAIRIEIEQRARESTPGRARRAFADSAVDPIDFSEDLETVRKKVPKDGSSPAVPKNGTPSYRPDTPLLVGDLEATQRSGATPFSKRVSELPMVPESRALSKEISDENDAAPLAVEINTGEHQVPALRHDIGDPFEGPLMPDELSSETPALVDSEPSLSLGEAFDEPEVAPTHPSVVSGRARSRLTTFGVLFFVIAALIAVAALAMLGDETAPEEKVRVTPPASELAASRAQPPDVPPPEPEGTETPVVDPPPAPPPPAPPPPVAPPPPAVVKSPPPAPPPPVVSPPPSRTPPPSRPPPEKAKPPPAKDYDDLDEKADEALAKLLGEERKQTDREISVACDEGDGKACVELGDRLATKKVADKAAKAFERACTFGIADGCHRAAVIEGVEAKPELEARACELGRKLSCKEPPAPPPPEVAKTETSST